MTSNGMDCQEIKNHISAFLEAMSMPFDRIDVVDENGYTTFMIHSSEARHLIGVRGEAFEALRHLLYRVINTRSSADTGAVFTVDVNHYYTKKLKSLLQNADLAAKRARFFKQDVELSPMEAHERMIIHAKFASDPEITTESTGVGKFRRVVLRCGTPKEEQFPLNI